MANSLYGKGKQRMLAGQISFSADTIKAVLVSADYLPSINIDEFLAAVQPYVLGGEPVTLENKSITLGAFDADDVNWSRVAAGGTVKAVVLFKDTGEAATSPLLAYIDAVTGFPVATNGADIAVQWDSGTFKIFSL